MFSMTSFYIRDKFFCSSVYAQQVHLSLKKLANYKVQKYKIVKLQKLVPSDGGQPTPLSHSDNCIVIKV